MAIGGVLLAQRLGAIAIAVQLRLPGEIGRGHAELWTLHNHRIGRFRLQSSPPAAVADGISGTDCSGMQIWLGDAAPFASCVVEVP